VGREVWRLTARPDITLTIGVTYDDGKCRGSLRVAGVGPIGSLKVRATELRPPRWERIR
jgi:hypothetical protein